MKKILFLLSLFVFEVQAALIYPGQTTDITFEPTTGEYSPSWTTDNPTLHLSSVGFLCHITAQAYFGGTATVTCTYKDRIGASVYTRTRKWTFTCADSKISISPTSKNIKVNESFQLSWSFSNATYISPTVQFTGYDSNILTVSNSGLVTAKSEGTTQIYVKSNLGTNSAICSVKVNSSGSNIGVTSAYDDWDSTNTKVITLEQPGTLSDFISASEKYSITNLTIVGPLNGYDLRLLRDMCGRDENNSATNGKLVILDLKDAVFVSGGPWYLATDGGNSYQYTSDTPFMPPYSFAWMYKLKKIRFPKYCTELTNGSLLQCKSLELMSIPPGVTTLDYNSLNGGYGDMPMSVLTLPSSMKNFDASIYRCGNLTDVYCYAVEPPTVKRPYTFESGTNMTNGTLYVPKGCAESYWRAEGWRVFKDIKETLDVFNTFSIFVGEHGQVNYKNVEIRQKYGASYTGYQAFEVPSDEELTVEIIPEEGYSVSNILINDQPQNMETDRILKIGKLTAHTQLKVSFDKRDTSIDKILDDDETFTMDVFNSQGIIVRKNIKREEMSNLPAGLYIVKTGNKTYKVLQQ